MTIHFGPLQIGVDDDVVWNGRRLRLRPLERRLLAHLARHPDRVHTREALIGAVWGDGKARVGRTVDVHVARLRRALDGGGHALVTVRRVGYRLDRQALEGTRR